MKKGKLGTILVILVTLVLAGVAIFTAIRLYQLRQQSVAPNVPSSKPAAAVTVGEGQVCGGTQGILCQSGFLCLKSDGRPPVTDQTGTCVSTARAPGVSQACTLNFSLC